MVLNTSPHSLHDQVPVLIRAYEQIDLGLLPHMSNQLDPALLTASSQQHRWLWAD